MIIFVFTNKNKQHFLKKLTNFSKIGEVLVKNQPVKSNRKSHYFLKL